MVVNHVYYRRDAAKLKIIVDGIIVYTHIPDLAGVVCRVRGDWLVVDLPDSVVAEGIHIETSSRDLAGVGSVYAGGYRSI